MYLVLIFEFDKVSMKGHKSVICIHLRTVFIMMLYTIELSINVLSSRLKLHDNTERLLTKERLVQSDA